MSIKVLLLAALSLPIVALAQTPSPYAAGCLFYKQQAFIPDAQAALVEYRLVTSNTRQHRVTLMNGTTITVMQSTDPTFVPYPGKLAATADEAIPMIEVAKYRYPKYNAFLAKVRGEWNRFAAKPVEDQKAAMERADTKQRVADAAVAAQIDANRFKGEKNEKDVTPLLGAPEKMNAKKER